MSKPVFTPEEVEAWAKLEAEIPPCKHCGRLLYCGGPCCPQAALDMVYLITKERDHARKMQGKEAAKADKWMKRAKRWKALAKKLYK